LGEARSPTVPFAILEGVSNSARENFTTVKSPLQVVGSFHPGTVRNPLGHIFPHLLDRR
jgi:hypothetical protein